MMTFKKLEAHTHTHKAPLSECANTMLILQSKWDFLLTENKVVMAKAVNQE